MSNPYGNYQTTNRSDRDTNIQFNERNIALDKAFSDISNNKQDFKPNNLSVDTALDESNSALDEAFSDQSKNQQDRVMYEDMIRKQYDIRTKSDDLSVAIALNQRKYIKDDPTYFSSTKKYFKKPHQRSPQDTLIIMSILFNKILENPKNILSDITKSDDAIYCTGIFLLLSGTSLYLLSNIFS